MKGSCPAWFNWVVLIVGVIYLLGDLGMATWWNLNWWTVVFILWGLAGLSGGKS